MDGHGGRSPIACAPVRRVDSVSPRSQGEGDRAQRCGAAGSDDGYGIAPGGEGDAYRRTQRKTGAGLSVRVAGLACLLSCIAAHALAESTPAGTTVLGVRAGTSCLNERIRITGFAMPREEGGASVPFDGYRVTDILVSEGDAVTLGQELLKASRLGGDDPAAAALRPAALPPVFSLRSPMAGKVSRLNVRVGTITGQPGPPAGPGLPPEPQIRISGDSGTDLLVDVPSLYATKIRAGLAARVLADDAEEIKATVRVPVSEVDPATQLGRARLTIEPASALRPGQFASVVIETARDCGLAVPRSAVSYRNGAPTVQVLNGSAIETRNVRTGLFDEASIQIRDGLSEGELVVANAGTALRSGDRVTPVVTDRAGRPSQ